VEWNEAKFSIIGLVILGVVWQYLGSPPTEILTLIVVGIAGLGGYELRGRVERLRSEVKVLGGVKWHEYYLRAIGFFLAFGGFGLIADELIGGYLDFTTWGHEYIGVILFLVGLGLISVKPRGK